MLLLVAALALAAVPRLEDCGGTAGICSGVRGPPIDAPPNTWAGRIAVWHMRLAQPVPGAVACLALLDPDAPALPDHRVSCPPAAARVVQAWAPELAALSEWPDAVVVWVSGLDAVAVSPLTPAHYAQLEAIVAEPAARPPPDARRCRVRTVVGGDGVPLIAAAGPSCSPEQAEQARAIALSRRFCPPDVCGWRGPVWVDLPVSW